MQDKNFTVRLQAAIDKSLIESLKEITLDYLQGEKKAPTFAEAPKP